MERKTKPVHGPGILSRSIGALVEHPKVFLGLSLLIQAPQIALGVLRDTGAMALGPEEVSPLAILSLLLPMLLLTQLQTAVLSTGVRAHLAGAAPTVQDTVAGGLRRFGPTLATAIAVAVAATFGFAFFVIPGWIVLAGCFVAVPAVQREGLSPIEALQRSLRLTSRDWFAFFALVFVFTIAERLVAVACLWLETPFVIPVLLAVPITALQAIAATVAYTDLAAGTAEGETGADLG